MCLLAAAWHAHPDYPLILAANRDEFHARPSLPAHLWNDPPQIIGGRDLRGGGTWLAAGPNRVAAVTNVYEGKPPTAGAPSRGALPVAYVQSGDGAAAYAHRLLPRAREYPGFNLLLATREELVLISNRLESALALEPGIHAISNARPGEDWPKTRRAREALQEVLVASRDEPELVSAAFALLAERLPNGNGTAAPGQTGAGDHRLASIFVAGPEYGTRCSTVVMLDRAGRTSLWERQFAADGRFAGETHLRTPADG